MQLGLHAAHTKSRPTWRKRPKLLHQGKAQMFPIFPCQIVSLLPSSLPAGLQRLELCSPCTSAQFSWLDRKVTHTATTPDDLLGMLELHPPLRRRDYCARRNGEQKHADGCRFGLAPTAVLGCSAGQHFRQKGSHAASAAPAAELPRLFTRIHGSGSVRHGAKGAPAFNRFSPLF